MKRILTLALVACFVLSAGLVSAKEMQFQGQFEHSLEWTDNANFLKTGENVTNNPGAGDTVSEDDFVATQRVRMYFQYIDSEMLRGVVGFEIDTVWGSPIANTGGKTTGGGALGTDGTTVEVKHAYTDFNLGGLAMRVGLQPLTWPSAVAGNPIWNNDVAGIVASYQFNDVIGLTVGWARLMDRQLSDTNAILGSNGSADDEIDAFTAIMPITMDGWSVTPYTIYAKVGKDSGGYGADFALPSLASVNSTAPLGDGADVWWIGTAISVNAFDPLTFGLDVIYGNQDGTNNNQNDRSGWFMATNVDYKLDMVTPGLVFMYGSGDDEDAADGSEAMPTLGGAGPNSNTGFALTSFGFAGNAATTTGDLFAQDARYDKWAVGLVLKDFSLIENLTQQFRLVYGQGTTDSELIKNNTNFANRPLLTEDDSFWEINLDSSYQIYENLALNSEFGYIQVDLDDDVWKAQTGGRDLEEQAAWKLAFTLRYNF